MLAAILPVVSIVSQPVTEVDMHSLHSSIGCDASFTQLSANSTLLHTSKGDAEVRIVTAVDPNH